MEIWISYTLRIGVLIAGAIIAIGVALLLLRGAAPGQPVSLADLRAEGGRPAAVHPVAMIRSALRAEPAAVIQVGVVALILTPVTRVAMTIVLFLAERDRIFVAVTAAVLAVLALGLIGIGA